MAGHGVRRPSLAMQYIFTNIHVYYIQPSHTELCRHLYSLVLSLGPDERIASCGGPSSATCHSFVDVLRVALAATAGVAPSLNVLFIHQLRYYNIVGIPAL